MSKILVIDDDENIRRYFDCLLSRLGYEVALAANGKEGLARILQADIDVVISDLFMPGVPFGVELIRQIREKHPACPIVVISGQCDSQIIADCVAIGINEFLTKPFEMGFIRDVLERLAVPRAVEPERP